MAQLLAADMTPLGQPIALGTDAARDISVVYNPDDDEFLVVWRDELVAPPQPGRAASPLAVTPTPLPLVTQAIYARRIRSDGSVAGPATALATQVGTWVGGQFAAPTVAYNTQDHEYLVVYQHSQQGLFKRRVSRSGAVIAEVSALPAPLGFHPRLAYNSAAHQYLLVYLNFEQLGVEPGTHLVAARAQVLSAQGLPQGESVIIPTDISPDTRALVYNAPRDEYLVSLRSSLARLSGAGAVVGQAIPALVDALDLGVDAQGRYLVVEHWGLLARPLDFQPHCPTTPTPDPGAPTATATPSSVPGVTQWQGIVQAIQPAGAVSEWTVGGQRAIVTQLTRIETYAGPARVGARVEVVAHQQSGQNVADAIIVQPSATPPATVTPDPTAPAEPRRYPLYLPYLAQERDGATGP